MDLAELLSIRGAPLNERELWAVCHRVASEINSQLHSFAKKPDGDGNAPFESQFFMPNIISNN